MRQRKIVSVVSLISIFGGIDGIQRAKFGLLIDRTLSIYLIVRLKALASAIVMGLERRGRTRHIVRMG
jgi:hypothetical protein